MSFFLGENPRPLQTGVFWVCLVNFIWSAVAMAVNPSFATGDGVTAERVLGVDFNGWHALSGLILFGPGMLACRRYDLTRIFALASVPAIAGPGLWALLSKNVLGLWHFDHQGSDAILHFTIAAIFSLLLLADRASGPATAQPAA
jgi:hypothetical protein